MLINNMSFKELPLMEPKDGTVLFYPYISKSSFSQVKKVLSGRWIGQGPLVDKFENKFKNLISTFITLFAHVFCICLYTFWNI